MVEIIYEDPSLLPFCENALDEMGVEVRRQFIEKLEVDVNQPPDNIVYINRVSASAHTRGHTRAVLLIEQYLEHLAAFNRMVINGLSTIDYEFSRVAQYQLFKRHGLSYPNTVFGSDIKQLINNASALRFPVTVKHNRTDNELPVAVIDSHSQLEDFLSTGEYLDSPDGIILVQEHIEPKHGRIFRLEFVDGRFIYACTANPASTEDSRLSFLPDFEHPLVQKYENILSDSGYNLARFTLVEAINGAVYTCSVCGTSDYPTEIENDADGKGRRAFQDMISRKLQ